MSFVVELEQGRTVGVFFFEVQVMDLGFAGRMPAFLTYVNFGSAFFVSILMLHAVNF